jgi:lipoprotein-anchoring transpeptidase ErfK/SrfK
MYQRQEFSRMRRLVMALALAIPAVAAATPSQAQVVARIDRSTQTMKVWVDGQYAYQWPVSTGRSGYSTPTGAFRAQRLERKWYSRKYDNAPMHNAVFFNGGYAVHGTSYVSQLGTPASHGCVRLHPSNAAEFFDLVASRGGRAKISVVR